MYISEIPFTYNGQQSYLYGLRFAWVNQSPDTIMASSKDYKFIKNRTHNNFIISKTRYENPLQFDAEIISDRVLKEPEVRRIYKLFFNSNTFEELSIPTGGFEKINLNCVMINPERIEGGIGNDFGVVGFKCTIICDSPWGWTEEKTIEPMITVVGVDNNFCNFIINNTSDSLDYIYPEVSFKIPSAENCSVGTRTEFADYCVSCGLKKNCRESIDVPLKAMIINETDNLSRSICVSAQEGMERTVVMNPSLGTIKDDYRDSLISHSNKCFIRLLPGENVFYAENINWIRFKFKEARALV
ncbi:MAG: hypothetical protein IJA34_01015 [Lachnospiraceae bacterium]|nr:hypothetical protein [Lachnospiraceae bacterium]